VAIASLLLGVFIAMLLFFGLWSIVDLLLDIFTERKAGIVHEILWTLCYSVPFLVIAIRVRYHLGKHNVNISSFFSFPICVPTICWLYVFAGIADAPHKEYIPRIIWVMAPGIAYAVGLRIRLYQTQD
jgi:hypothetical protein